MRNMKKSTLLITFTSLLFIFILYSNAAPASQSQGQETPSQLAHRLFKTVKQIKKPIRIKTSFYRLQKTK